MTSNDNVNTKTMAPGKQAQESQEEDYMDDLITLVHDDKPIGEPAEEDSSSDVEFVETIVTNTKNQEAGKVEVIPNVPENDGAIPETSAYGKKHLERNTLSVNFFDSSRNVQLLTECRPLSVQVVDFVKHPPRAHKSRVLASETRKPPYRSYLSLNKSSKKIDRIERSNKHFSCTLKQNNVLKIVKNKSFPDLPPEDTFNPASGESLKIGSKNGDVGTKTIDFKKNKGLIGLKITNRILKVEPEQNAHAIGLKITNRILQAEPEQNPNADRNKNNNFVGHKILQSQSVNPKLSHTKKTKKVIKVSNKSNFTSNRFNKTCNTKKTYPGKNTKTCVPQANKLTETDTKIVGKVVAPGSMDSCNNQISNVQKNAPTLPDDIKKQTIENKDNSIQCIKMPVDSKKTHEVSIKCRLKLDPHIAPEFLKKFNDEVKTDHRLSINSVSKDLKNENSRGESLKRQNVSCTLIKNRSNHESSNDLKNEGCQKINNTNVCSTVRKAKYAEDTHTERDRNTELEVQNQTVQLINVSKLCDPNVQSVSQKAKYNNETDDKIQMERDQKHNGLKISDLKVQTNLQKTKYVEKNNVKMTNEEGENLNLSKIVPQKVKYSEVSNVKVQNERDQSSKFSKMCELKVQTVSQINNSFTKVETSGVTTNDSQLDNVGPIVCKLAQFPEETKIKTENEIKKECDDITDTCVTSQNILHNNLVQQCANIDEGNVNSTGIVGPMLQINRKAISADTDSAVLSSDLKPFAADLTLLPPPTPNQSIVTPVTYDASFVLTTTPHNHSSVRRTLPQLCLVKSTPHNVSSVRPIPQNAISSIPPANNAHQVNNPHESANRVAQFWPQPSEIRPTPIQEINLSNRRDIPPLNQAILLPNVNNSPPNQHMVPINEMQHHLISHWQHRNELNNMNMAPDYNNSQTPNSALLMKRQQLTQSENQMPLYMHQRNSHQGNSEHIVYNNYLTTMNDNSYMNPLLSEGLYFPTTRPPLLSPPPPLLPPPPPPLLPPPPTLLPPPSHLLPPPPPLLPPQPPPKTPGPAHHKIATERNRNNNKGTNDSPNKLKNSSILAVSAGQTLKPEISHKILGSYTGKTLPVIVNSLNTLVSARTDTKQLNEGNLANTHTIDEKKETTLSGLTVKRAANTCINSEAPKKIQLIPQQTSAKTFIRLNSETGPSYSNTNQVSKGYSPPILPIPTLSKSIELMQIFNSMQNKRRTVDKTVKSLNRSNKTHVVCRPRSIIKKVSLEKTPKNKQPLTTYAIKKISLEEYKRRMSKDGEKIIDLTLDEKSPVEVQGEDDKLGLDRVGNVERRSVDSQDLGYDSDSTVKL